MNPTRPFNNAPLVSDPPVLQSKIGNPECLLNRAAPAPLKEAKKPKKKRPLNNQFPSTTISQYFPRTHSDNNGASDPDIIILN